MKFEELLFTYRGLEKLPYVVDKFGKSLNKVLLTFISVFLIVFNIFRLNNIFIFYLKKRIKLITKDHKKIAFVFSKNQNKILLKLRSLGFNFPAYFFNINQTQLENDLFVSDKLILISFLANKNNVTLFKKASDHPILGKDLVRVCKVIGLELIYEDILKGKEEIISFNDHTPYNVLLNDMAQKSQIKTIYMQHAPINKNFPPLYHDTNILFSEDSVDKYRRINENINIVVACDLRFLIEIDESKVEKNNILFCPNAFDDFDIINLFIQKISKTHTVLLRPHPNDKRDWSKISNCKKSTSFEIWDDLQFCDIVITNESAVSLEAIFYGKKLYKAAFLSKSLDHYLFLKKGLILREYNDMDHMISAINNNQIDFNKEKLNYFIGDISNPKSVLQPTLG